MSSAVDIVRRFHHLRAVVIGDAILDTYLQGTAERLCIEGPVPVVRKREERRLPGGAANTAANLQALGAHVTLIGVVGRDMPGQMLRNMLRERGIEDRWLITDESIETQHKLRILADDQYVVRFDEGTAHAPSAFAERQMLAGLKQAIQRCDVIVISDYCYGAVTESLVRRARAESKRNGAPLIVDSKQLGHFRRAGATVVTPNLSEARELVAAHQKLPFAPAADDGAAAYIHEGQRLAVALLSILDTQVAAVTLDQHGVALATRTGLRAHIAAHPVVRPNDVGAGDSFTSALALALAGGAEPDDAARIGIDAASIAVSKRFTSQVERRELLQRVSLREQASDAELTAPASKPAARRQALARLRARLDLERAAGHVIVFTNGVFDVLHAGHLAFLRKAKALGDILVVGVNTDHAVRQYISARPLLTSEHDRLALLAALEPVDDVVLFDEETPAQLIRMLRPDIHVKGGDYADEPLPEAEAVREVGGRVVIVPLAGAAHVQTALGDERMMRLPASAPDVEPDVEGSHAHVG